LGQDQRSQGLLHQGEIIDAKILTAVRYDGREQANAVIAIIVERGNITILFIKNDLQPPVPMQGFLDKGEALSISDREMLSLVRQCMPESTRKTSIG
jgi:hypothetical protein